MKRRDYPFGRLQREVFARIQMLEDERICGREPPASQAGVCDEQAIECVARPRNAERNVEPVSRRRVILCPSLVAEQVTGRRRPDRAHAARLGQELYFKEVGRRDVEATRMSVERLGALVTALQPE